MKIATNNITVASPQKSKFTSRKEKKRELLVYKSLLKINHLRFEEFYTAA